ncbi:MAG: hypothetical protein AB8B63_19485 [Granulosicoccus sp.]
MIELEIASKTFTMPNQKMAVIEALNDVSLAGPPIFSICHEEAACDRVCDSKLDVPRLSLGCAA